ncbi:hypothetical protein IW261DRAFT_1609549 [Armillaria novae-zelandiae]|uniref:Uncharacterized protein n=1 Tax=Armillaria novae-zelandiae TaxID=153914 RepID=A0AA39P2G1_9AGAR|nr:hypothetical protein IW261DRAFT_1609549 [Armillaria novae-zelandiae]
MTPKSLVYSTFCPNIRTLFGPTSGKQTSLVSPSPRYTHAPTRRALQTPLPNSTENALKNWTLSVVLDCLEVEFTRLVETFVRRKNERISWNLLLLWWMNDGVPKGTYTNPWLGVTVAPLALLPLRYTFAVIFPTILGVFLFTCKLNRDIISMLSRMNMSIAYKTLLPSLHVFASDANTQLRAFGATLDTTGPRLQKASSLHVCLQSKFAC